MQELPGGLPKRRLGRTRFQATVLGFGALEVRGVVGGIGRKLAPGQAEGILNAALDAGINFIDTAIDYGESEENIGRYIAHRRSEYFLASKVGCQLDSSKVSANERTYFGVPLKHYYTRENIVDGVHQSLRRMKTDHLDLVQFHMSPPKADLDRDGSIETLLELKRQGKIRFIGSSSTLPNLTQHIKMRAFDAFQISYSALQREHEQAITDAAKSGAGTIIRGGVARGEPGEGQGTERLWGKWEATQMDELLNGDTRTEFVLRFTLSHPDVQTIIVGTANPGHLMDNVRTVYKGPLPADVYEEAKRRLSAVPTQ